MSRRSRNILPGFGLSLGYTVFYFSLIVLIPLSAIVLRTARLSWSEFIAAVGSQRVLAAYRLSIVTSLLAAAVNTVFGLLVAWVLVRYRFPGKRLIDAIIDLPFALPTAVAGIVLTTLYAPTGWIGGPLAKLGITAVFTPLGIVIALTFIGLPFVVRTVQPVLEGVGRDFEEAAHSLGASRVSTFFRVILPEIRPALLTGFALAFARGLGEYGSVVFISGNMPMKTEIAPLLIVNRLEEFDYSGATAIALVMLAGSFALLLGINYLQRRYQLRLGVA
jgi:sulfate transport system permease protein